MTCQKTQTTTADPFHLDALFFSPTNWDRIPRPGARAIHQLRRYSFYRHSRSAFLTSSGIKQALLCSCLEAYIGNVIVVVYKSKFDSSIAILSTRNILNNEKKVLPSVKELTGMPGRAN